jgi:hypothetical protein
LLHLHAYTRGPMHLRVLTHATSQTGQTGRCGPGAGRLAVNFTLTSVGGYVMLAFDRLSIRDFCALLAALPTDLHNDLKVMSMVAAHDTDCAVEHHYYAPMRTRVWRTNAASEPYAHANEASTEGAWSPRGQRPACRSPSRRVPAGRTTHRLSKYAHRTNLHQCTHDSAIVHHDQGRRSPS